MKWKVMLSTATATPLRPFSGAVHCASFRDSGTRACSFIDSRGAARMRAIFDTGDPHETQDATRRAPSVNCVPSGVLEGRNQNVTDPFLWWHRKDFLCLPSTLFCSETEPHFFWNGWNSYRIVRYSALTSVLFVILGGLREWQDGELTSASARSPRNLHV